MEEENEVSGYVRTHWECPRCGFPNETEGNATEREVECRGCHRQIMVREVF